MGKVVAQPWEITSEKQAMGRMAIETSKGKFIATASNCCSGNLPDNFTIIADSAGNIINDIPVGGFSITLLQIEHL